MKKNVAAWADRWARLFGGRARVRNRLLLLLATLLIPILLIEVFIYASRFRDLFRHEIQSNLEVSRAVSRLFGSFVDDMLRQEAAIGLALSATASLPPEQARLILARFQALYPALHDLRWVHPAGWVLYSSRPQMEGVSLADQVWFQEVLGGKDWSISELFLSRATGRPVFTISRAARDPAGGLLGFVTATVEPARLYEVLEVEREGGGEVLVIDRAGRIAYRHPQAEWSWESRGILEREPAVREALGGREVTTTGARTPDGAKRIFAFSPIGRTGWVAGASRPAREALLPVLRALSAHAGLLLLVILLSLAPAAAIAYSITHPLGALRQAALTLRSRERKAAGPFDPAAIRGPGEVRELAAAFAEMDLERSAQEERLELQYQRVKLLASTMRSLARDRSRSLARLGRLIELSAAILAESSPAEVLEKTAEGARELMAADLAAVQIDRPDGTVLQRSAGAAPAVIPADATASGDGLARDLQRRLGRRACLRLYGRKITPILAAAGWKSLLAARMADPEGRTGGLLWAARRERAGFDGEDEALLAQLASLVLLRLRNLESRDAALQRAAEAEEGRRALRQARELLEERVRERTAELSRANEELLRYQRRLRALASELATTAERERQKVAGEVHDRIGQALSLSRMRLGLLRGRLPSEQACEADEIGRLLEKTIQDVRGLIFELYPPVLHHAGLVAALQWLADRLRERYGLEVRLENRLSADPPGRDLQALLFRSAQELLMNVVLHARTSTARVRLRGEEGSLVVEVEDGGAGFRPEEAECSPGFGLFGIQEQLAPLGGSLRVESAPGKGTRAVLRAPMQAGQVKPPDAPPSQRRPGAQAV